MHKYNTLTGHVHMQYSQIKVLFYVAFSFSARNEVHNPRNILAQQRSSPQCRYPAYL